LLRIVGLLRRWMRCSNKISGCKWRSSHEDWRSRIARRLTVV
jgi:hypothetical protein